MVASNREIYTSDEDSEDLNYKNKNKATRKNHVETAVQMDKINANFANKLNEFHFDKSSKIRFYSNFRNKRTSMYL